jgi:hypothetical protein
MVGKANEDRLVFIGYLIASLTPKKRKKLLYHSIDLGLEEDFVSGLMEEGADALKRRKGKKL